MRRKIGIVWGITIIVSIICLAMLGGCKQAESPQNTTTEKAAAAPPPKPSAPVTQGVTDTEIKVGAWSPQTGPGAPWGALNRGTKAYFDWINEQGGIHGRKLNLIIRDDGYSPPRTVAAVKELTDNQKVFAFVAGVGTPTGMAVKDSLDEKGIINIGMGSGALSWTNPMSKYRYGVYPPYQTEARLLVKYAVETLGAKKIAMFYQNDGFGKEGLMGAEAGCKEMGIELAYKITYELTDTDLSAQALKVKSSGADTVIIWSTAKHAAAFIKEAGKIAYKPQFMATSTLSDPIMFKLAGDAWNGLVIANWMPMLNDDTEGMKHYRDAMAKFDPDDRLGNFTLAGFILAEPFVEGLRRAGRDLTTESLVNALDSIQGFNGDFVHDLNFSKDDHQGLKSIYFIKAENGKLKKISDWMQ